MTIPGVALPGIGWLPTPLRQRAYWRLVGFCVALGPLIGGLPYVVFLVTIPFAYVVGAVPALLAGLLYGAWRLSPGLRPPTWPWRAAIGALSGVAAAAGSWGLLHTVSEGVDAGLMPVLALHGAPAGAVLGLWEPWARKARRKAGAAAQQTPATTSAPAAASRRG